MALSLNFRFIAILFAFVVFFFASTPSPRFADALVERLANYTALRDDIEFRSGFRVGATIFVAEFDYSARVLKFNIDAATGALTFALGGNANNWEGESYLLSAWPSSDGASGFFGTYHPQNSSAGAYIVKFNLATLAREGGARSPDNHGRIFAGLALNATHSVAVSRTRPGKIVLFDTTAFASGAASSGPLPVATATGVTGEDFFMTILRLPASAGAAASSYGYCSGTTRYIVKFDLVHMVRISRMTGLTDEDVLQAGVVVPAADNNQKLLLVFGGVGATTAGFASVVVFDPDTGQRVGGMFDTLASNFYCGVTAPSSTDGMVWLGGKIADGTGAVSQFAVSTTGVQRIAGATGLSGGSSLENNFFQAFSFDTSGADGTVGYFTTKGQNPSIDTRGYLVSFKLLEPTTTTTTSTTTETEKSTTTTSTTAEATTEATTPAATPPSSGAATTTSSSTSTTTTTTTTTAEAATTAADGPTPPPPAGTTTTTTTTTTSSTTSTTLLAAATTTTSAVLAATPTTTITSATTSISNSSVSTSTTGTTTAPNETTSDSPFANFSAPGLAADVQRDLQAAASVVSALAGLFASPVMAMSAQRALGSFALAGCPAAASGRTAWSQTPLSFPRTFFPGSTAGSDQGGHARAAMLGFFFLGPIIVVVVILVWWSIFKRKELAEHKQHSAKRAAAYLLATAPFPFGFSLYCGLIFAHWAQSGGLLGVVQGDGAFVDIVIATAIPWIIAIVVAVFFVMRVYKRALAPAFGSAGEAAGSKTTVNNESNDDSNNEISSQQNDNKIVDVGETEEPRREREVVEERISIYNSRFLVTMRQDERPWVFEMRTAIGKWLETKRGRYWVGGYFVWREDPAVAAATVLRLQKQQAKELQQEQQQKQQQEEDQHSARVGAGDCVEQQEPPEAATATLATTALAESPVFRDETLPRFRNVIMKFFGPPHPGEADKSDELKAMAPLRFTLAPFTFPVMVLLSVISAFTVGVAQADMSGNCVGALVLMMLINICATAWMLALRPFMVPVRNVVAITVDVVLVFSSVVCLALATQPAESVNSGAAVVQILTSITVTVASFLEMALTLIRNVLLYLLGIKILSKGEYKKAKREQKRHGPPPRETTLHELEQQAQRSDNNNDDDVPSDHDLPLLPPSAVSEGQLQQQEQENEEMDDIEFLMSQQRQQRKQQNDDDDDFLPPPSAEQESDDIPNVRFAVSPSPVDVRQVELRAASLSRELEAADERMRRAHGLRNDEDWSPFRVKQEMALASLLYHVTEMVRADNHSPRSSSRRRHLGVISEEDL